MIGSAYQRRDDRVGKLRVDGVEKFIGNCDEEINLRKIRWIGCGAAPPLKMVLLRRHKGGNA
jgi:hypothetical protein